MSDFSFSYRRVRTASVYVNDEGRVYVCARPDDIYPDGALNNEGEHPHNCDQMGCGQLHVVATATVPNWARALGKES